MLPQVMALDRKKVRHRFEQRFSATRMAKDYLKVYRSLLASPQFTEPEEAGSVSSIAESRWHERFEGVVAQAGIDGNPGRGGFRDPLLHSGNRILYPTSPNSQAWRLLCRA